MADADKEFAGKTALVTGGAMGIGAAGAGPFPARGAKVPVVPPAPEPAGGVAKGAAPAGAQRGVAAYTTGKHGLIGLTRSMALDFAADGVRVNAVAPGSVDTPMLRRAVSLDPNPEALMKTVRGMHPLGRIAEPREVAEAVA